KPVSSEIPLRCGPRHCGQSLARIVSEIDAVRSATVRMANEYFINDSHHEWFLLCYPAILRSAKSLAHRVHFAKICRIQLNANTNLKELWDASITTLSKPSAARRSCD